MALIHCIPWIRFADELCFVQQQGPSKTYDCRMLYTLKGEATLEMDGNVYTLRHGYTVLLQPGPQYRIRPAGSVTLTVLDFDYTQDYANRIAFLLPCPTSNPCIIQRLPHTPSYFAQPNITSSHNLLRSFLSCIQYCR